MKRGRRGLRSAAVSHPPYGAANDNSMGLVTAPPPPSVVALARPMWFTVGAYAYLMLMAYLVGEALIAILP